MLKLFNHYVPSSTIQRLVFDALLLFVAVVVDGLVIRKVKFATFGYSSPIRFSISAHSMIVVGLLPVLYLVVPLPVTPLFLPFWLLLSAVPIMTLLSNTQRI